MHDYKGLVGGWQKTFGLYGSMWEKQREIMKTEGNEKEKDCAVTRVNTYRVGAQAELKFVKQEMAVDMTPASQVFLVEQISFHRKIADWMEKLYYECWPCHEGVGLSSEAYKNVHKIDLNNFSLI